MGLVKPLTLVLVLVAAAGPSQAQENRSQIRMLGDDVFVAGPSVYFDRAVRGDLIAAGGELRLGAPVAGAALAAAGQLSFDGSVAGNARMAGGRVVLGPNARIEGNASLAGGRVEVRGAVGGYLQAAGGSVLIDGPVQGDVEVAAGELELGPQARIAGTLRYWGGERLQRHASAQVLGPVVEREIPMREPPDAGEAAGAAFGIWTLGLMVLAAVLVAALPVFTARISEAGRGRFGWSLLAGLLAIAAVPLAVVLLMITVVGIPLALLALLLYPPLLLVGYAASGVALGTGVLKRASPARALRTGWRALAAALGVLAIALLALVPWLGFLVVVAALLAGVGAVLLALRSSMGGPSAQRV